MHGEETLITTLHNGTQIFQCRLWMRKHSLNALNDHARITLLSVKPQLSNPRKHSFSLIPLLVPTETSAPTAGGSTAGTYPPRSTPYQHLIPTREHAWSPTLGRQSRNTWTCTDLPRESQQKNLKQKNPNITYFTKPPKNPTKPHPGFILSS